MGKWIIALTTVAVASASASTYFWRELRAEREQTAALQTRIAQLERPPAAAPPVDPVAESMNVDAAPAASTPPPTPASAKAEAVLAGGATFSMVPMGRPMDPQMRQRMLESHEQQQRMLKDPEYRELMRAQLKFNMQQQYADLAPLLGLSQEESDRLLDVLTEQSLRNQEHRPMLADFSNEPPSEAEMIERRRVFEEQRRNNESEIAAVLGSKFSDWQQYQQNGWARSQVTQLRQALSSGDEPLRQDQIKPLVEAIAREQKQQFDTMGAMRAYAAPGRPDAMAQARRAEEWVERTAQTHQRIRAAVSGLLTSAQYEQLERQQQQELKMQELAARQQRARAEAQARGELPPDSANTIQAVTMFPQ